MGSGRAQENPGKIEPSICALPYASDLNNDLRTRYERDIYALTRAYLKSDLVHRVPFKSENYVLTIYESNYRKFSYVSLFIL